MFEAVDETGRRINIHLVQVEQLKQMTLYCPYCLNRLRVRQGRKRTHFVHVSACTGESSAHQGWKTTLAEYFRSLGYDVALEQVQGQRRFDLWIPALRIAVEIQRSKMTALEWNRRRTIDQQKAYAVRWIGFHPTGGCIIKLDGWMKQALLTDGYLDLIEQGKINRYGFAVPFTKHLVICQRLETSFTQFIRPTPQAFPRKFSVKKWNQLVRKYRLRPFFSTMPNHLLKNPLYQAGLHVLDLPAHCFLPIETLLAFPLHPFELQITLYLSLQGNYSKIRLEHALVSCLDACRVSHEPNLLRRVVEEWMNLLAVARICQQSSIATTVNRFKEDAVLAGAIQLFVEKETGINEVRE
ncbi:competence protein CoiA family protein [Exiguobacterium sp. s133]|uniref:competence protein CoiA family protein n=1 Tax=Exiguobacterium sp. s133 TaxID=2751213 RepID=UPI001BE92FD2|nr:competence protein CoiA family protein [Exiguobacterium sp. s133]